MYQVANETITQGLSLGARLLLGSVAALFGVVMVLVAPDPEKAIYFHLFSAFCFLIAVACFTKGRVRQFIGSLIGSVVFMAGVWYFISQVSGGLLWSGRRSEPSVFNAVLYLLFIGIPGAVYAFRVRFGFAKQP